MLKLSPGEILSKVDHTLLTATCTIDQLETLCDEAIKYKCASVCVPPCYVKPLKEKYGDSLPVCCVIGFPLGYNSTTVKVFETETAIADGADEIDVVINVSYVKNGWFNLVKDELIAVRAASKGKIMKVIVETCYLTDNELIEMCHIVTDIGADYIKTSSGFGPRCVNLHDLRLFKQHLGPNVKIKASGGYSMLESEEMEMFILEGADRLGLSGAVRLLRADGSIK